MASHPTVKQNLGGRTLQVPDGGNMEQKTTQVTLFRQRTIEHLHQFFSTKMSINPRSSLAQNGISFYDALLSTYRDSKATYMD